MTRKALKIIKEAMESLGLEYGFMRYNKNPTIYPFWVGSYQENPIVSESGYNTSLFSLNGPLPLRQTQRSPEGPRHLHRIPTISEAPWKLPKVPGRR